MNLKKLDELAPEILEVKDVSHNPEVKGTHFYMLIVSCQFEGKTRLQRQREVFKLLGEIPYSLSLHTYTKEEWEQASPPKLPACTKH